MDLMAQACIRRAQAALGQISREDLMQGHFSLSRALSQMAHGGLEGAERETLELISARFNIRFDAARPTIPWELLSRRDLNTLNFSQGGALVSTTSLIALDMLRPYSVVAQLGVNVAAGLAGNAELGVVDTSSQHYWIDELGQISESSPTLKAIPMVPKTAGALVGMSRNFSHQANAEDFVRRQLFAAIGAAVDAAVIAGSGTGGQPFGLVNFPGIGTESGTSLAQAGVVSMKRKVADSNATNIAFIGTPAVRELLEKRERATGSGYIWDNDRVASCRAAASTAVPSGTLICADWSAMHLYLWGPGPVIEINPYDGAAFKTGRIEARVLVSLDTALAYPAAACVATSVT